MKENPANGLKDLMWSFLLVASAVAMSYMALFKGEAYLQKQSIEFIFGGIDCCGDGATRQSG